jgi:nicotinamide-nucleotide amidase
MSESTENPLVAEIISIGDEMTSGARLDTNSQWLCRRIGELGLQVCFHTTVGDTIEDNVDVFRIAARRADVIVSTGGLGPTRDDLTREAMAAAAGLELVMSDTALHHIESMFRSRGRTMPHRNQVQAMFPAGSQEVFNPQGTAPGIDLQFELDDSLDNRKAGGRKAAGRMFALPGVPAEMKRMFDETVSPRILEMATVAGSASGAFIRHEVMKFFGTGESDMEERLGNMIDRSRSPRVGITVTKATISLRITATGTSEESCVRQIEQTREEIMQRVSEFYFGDGEDFEQQHAIDQQLRSVGQSLCVIELGRAAPLGDWFAAIEPTASFRGALSLDCTERLLMWATADSVETAMAQMANQFGSDWVLLVDGYPSIDPKADKPMPASEVRIMVRDPEGQINQKVVSIGGHPSIIQPRIAKTAMQLFRTTLQQICIEGDPAGANVRSS